MRRDKFIPEVVAFVNGFNAASVVRAACDALRAYAMGDGCEDDIAAVCGIAALVDALPSFRVDPGVLEEACGALWNALGGGSDSVRAAALAAGAGAALRAVLAAHAADSPAGRMAQGALDCIA